MKKACPFTGLSCPLPPPKGEIMNGGFKKVFLSWPKPAGNARPEHNRIAGGGVDASPPLQGGGGRKKQRAIFFSINLLLGTFLPAQTLFEQLLPAQTGIVFQNTIEENSEEDNVLAYEYYYNGGGVAAGDLNNDGLPELFFSANSEHNHLYLNLGNLTFKEIAKPAGVRGRKGWKTGVTFADVNADGWLDIYLSYSGRGGNDSRRNQLFINNHDLTFTEQAKKFGLDDPGYGTQAAFFDFDRDGDLDCFILNHNIKAFRNFENESLRATRDPLAGDKLLENRNGHFYNITERAGIGESPLGFGLGLVVSDIDSDGWPDLYVSNDYNEPDYLYLNNRRGGFRNLADSMLGHMSQFSMGCDVADFNNDGRPDILTLDMLPEDNRRQKLLQGPENYETYELMVKTGLHHQLMRNMLHLNMGRAGRDSPVVFSEIGQLAGVSNTDWSWSGLFADFDNDGWKDILITNGYLRDYTNRDFLRSWGDYLIKKAASAEPPSLLELVRKMPATRLKNYLFRNDGADADGRALLTFTNVTDAWGAGQTAVSNGAAYADLDGDGDLEIVISNINEPAFIYKNKARESNQNDFIQFKFAENQQNTKLLGARIRVRFDDGSQEIHEQSPVRGYQSAVTEILHIGLGQKRIAGFDIFQPAGSPGWKRLNMADCIPNRINVIDPGKTAPEPPPGIAERLPEPPRTPLPILPAAAVHAEYDYNDFKRQPLLPRMLSRCGPALAKADVNGDGLDDVFMGGAKWQMSRLLLQRRDGDFALADTMMFRGAQFMTVAGAAFFDADGDRDADLYLASGGYEDYGESDPVLNDALYLNDGKGHFSKVDSLLPDMRVSKSCVRPADFDGDGDLDVFVGGRLIPGKYPLAPRSFLLENDGKGRFLDVTESLAPELLQPGLTTDAAWADLNGDARPDLLLCGEWMPVRVFGNEKGRLKERSADYFDRPFSGLWNRLLAADFDGDGDTDLVAGNLGLNSQMKASEQEPATLVYKDFDANGSVDPILCFYVQGKSFPFLTRDELLDQMVSMRPRFTGYERFATAGLSDMFTPAELKDADTLTVNRLETTYFENVNGRFRLKSLPPEAQFAPVFALATLEHTGTERKDLILAGNQSASRLRFGRYDAGYGQVFSLDGSGRWQVKNAALGWTGDIRSLLEIKAKGHSFYMTGTNNEALRVYNLNDK